MKQQILFVDDEPNILRGLRRMLYPLRNMWEMAFAENGREALKRLEETSYDVIVSDMRMPGMDGAQLLSEVRQNYPHIVRIILSGQSDREMILRSVGSAHQCLAKPCDADILKTTVSRAFVLSELLSDKEIKQAVAGMQTLPSLPTLYGQVIQAAQSASGSLEKIGQIIERDIGMTAKILQMVNSAFFGLQRTVSSSSQAVSLLGLDTVQALILSAEVFDELDQITSLALPLDAVWRHSMAVAACAKRIATVEHGEAKMIDDAFVAGLLHDTGNLVLAANHTENAGKTVPQGRTIRSLGQEAEVSSCAATHAEIGAYLLGLWGLPTAIVEAVAFHHNPSACPNQTFSLLTAVHVANALVDEAEATEDHIAVDFDYLDGLGLNQRLPVWREHCLPILHERGCILEEVY